MKKVISFVLAVVMLIGTTAFPLSAADMAETPLTAGVTATSAAAPITGDMNGDGVVNSDDAVYLLMHTLNPQNYPIEQSGDCNGDGKTDSDDAIYLLNYSLFGADKYPLKNTTATDVTGMTYSLNADGKGYTVTGIGTCTETALTIPDSYRGLPVTAIAADAFYGSDLVSVTVPKTVTAIGDGAFGYCESLTALTVSDGNTVYHSDGNCIVETAAKTLRAGCAASVIPADGSVTAIGDRAFEGCTGLTTLTVPSGVTTIGASAFSLCYRMRYAVLPRSLTQISDMAFSGCDIAFSSLYYYGNETEWDAMTIGSENEPIFRATLRYESGAQPVEGREDLYWHMVDGEPTPWTALPRNLLAVTEVVGLRGKCITAKVLMLGEKTVRQITVATVDSSTQFLLGRGIYAGRVDGNGYWHLFSDDASIASASDVSLCMAAPANTMIAIGADGSLTCDAIGMYAKASSQTVFALWNGSTLSVTTGIPAHSAIRYADGGYFAGKTDGTTLSYVLLWNAELTDESATASMTAVGYLDLSNGTYMNAPGYWVGVNPSNGLGLNNFYQTAAALTNTDVFSASGPMYADMVLYENDRLNDILSNTVTTGTPDIVLSGLTEASYQADVSIYFIAGSNAAYVQVQVASMYDSSSQVTYSLIGLYTKTDTAAANNFALTLNGVSCTADFRPAQHGFDWTALTPMFYTYTHQSDGAERKVTVTVKGEEPSNAPDSITAQLDTVGYLDLSGGMYFGYQGYWAGVSATSGEIGEFSKPANYLYQYYQASGDTSVFGSSASTLYTDMLLFESANVEDFFADIDFTTPDIVITGLCSKTYQVTVSIMRDISFDSFILNGAAANGYHLAYVKVETTNPYAASYAKTYYLIGIYHPTGSSVRGANFTLRRGNVTMSGAYMTPLHAYDWDAAVTHTLTYTYDGTQTISFRVNRSHEEPTPEPTAESMNAVGYLDLTGGSYYGYQGYWAGVSASSGEIGEFSKPANYLNQYYQASGDGTIFGSTSSKIFTDMLLFESTGIEDFFADVDFTTPDIVISGPCSQTYQVTVNIMRNVSYDSFVLNGAQTTDYHLAYVQVQVTNSLNSSYNKTYNLIGIYHPTGSTVRSDSFTVTRGNVAVSGDFLTPLHAFDWDAATTHNFYYSYNGATQQVSFQVAGSSGGTSTGLMNAVGYLDLSGGLYYNTQGYWAGVNASAGSIGEFSKAPQLLNNTTFFSQDGPMYADMLLYETSGVEEILGDVLTAAPDLTISGVSSQSYNVVVNIITDIDIESLTVNGQTLSGCKAAYVTMDVSNPYNSSYTATYHLIGIYAADGYSGSGVPVLTVNGMALTGNYIVPLHAHDWNAETSRTFTYVYGGQTQTVTITRNEAVTAQTALYGFLDLSAATYFGVPGAWLSLDDSALHGFTQGPATYLPVFTQGDTSTIDNADKLCVDMALYTVSDPAAVFPDLDAADADLVISGETYSGYRATVSIVRDVEPSRLYAGNENLLAAGYQASYVSIHLTDDYGTDKTYVCIGLSHPSGSSTAIAAETILGINNASLTGFTLAPQHAFDLDALTSAADVLTFSKNNGKTASVDVMLENIPAVAASETLRAYPYSGTTEKWTWRGWFNDANVEHPNGKNHVLVLHDIDTFAKYDGVGAYGDYAVQLLCTGAQNRSAYRSPFGIDTALYTNLLRNALCDYTYQGVIIALTNTTNLSDQAFNTALTNVIFMIRSMQPQAAIMYTKVNDVASTNFTSVRSLVQSFGYTYYDETSVDDGTRLQHILAFLNANTNTTRNTTPANAVPASFYTRGREGLAWQIIDIDDAKNVTGRPRVLLIGDSISIGYYSLVRDQLAGYCTVDEYGITYDASDPAFTRDLGALLDVYDYDIIHFNVGIHRTGAMEPYYGTGVATIMDYLLQKEPNAKIVFATTTPLGSNTPNALMSGRNAAAKAQAMPRGIGIDDLYQVCLRENPTMSDGIHFRDYTVLANSVVKTVRTILISHQK